MTSLQNSMYDLAIVSGFCVWVGERRPVCWSVFLFAAHILSKLNIKIFFKMGTYVLIQNQKLNLMPSQICLQLNKHVYFTKTKTCKATFKLLLKK